jgi:hypothetical protein
MSQLHDLLGSEQIPEVTAFEDVRKSLIAPPPATAMHVRPVTSTRGLAPQTLGFAINNLSY